ncbi:uncharacterized protein LOC107710986 [Sinocyclocheilus rhinocerous]|uniref:uncharacterized protein LOC107710986 n=1 Tax=Sinocyclocheilus rhinocerous TaxID=307959 RepID=UPI0007BA82C1|nr:PREDICTED: uncharacterized protein LOC107710986 [Sinocyclocheilus rhinocerous]
MSLWGSQMDLVDELKKGLSLSRSSVTDESELLDDDAISLTSSDPSRCQMRTKKSRLSPPNPPALRMMSCLRLWIAPQQGLTWKRAKKVTPRGRLDKHFLSSHSPPAQVSLPFIPDLHMIHKAWKNPFSSRIHRFQHTSYANIEGMRENGYEKMPPVEETLACYLSMGETSSLKAPSLLFKPLEDTSRLNGRAYCILQQVRLQPRCIPWWCFRLIRLIC